MKSTTFPGKPSKQQLEQTSQNAHALSCALGRSRSSKGGLEFGALLCDVHSFVGHIYKAGLKSGH